MRTKTKGPLIIWMTSLIVFFGSLYVGGVQNGLFNENQSIIKTIALWSLLGSFSTGVLAFTLLMVRSGISFFVSQKKKRKKRFKKKGQTPPKKEKLRFLFAALVLLTLIGSSAYADFKLKKKNLPKTIPSSTFKNTYEPPTKSRPTTPTPTPTYTPPKVSLMTCNFGDQCRGETRQMTKDQCANSTCCQIGNQWLVYTSKSKCKEDQVNNRIVPSTNDSYGSEKFSCSYQSGSYNYDYGMLTIDECRIKQDAYWENLKTVVPTYNPTQFANNAELLDGCLGDIARIYQSERTRLLNAGRAAGVNTSSAIDQLKKDLERLQEDCRNRYPLK